MKIRGALIILLLAMVIVYFLYFAKAGKKSYIEGAMDANDRMRGELTQVNMTTMQGRSTSSSARKGRRRPT